MEDIISVVITTYGRTKELKNAINSVLLQTYKNLNIIVVDDNVDNNISKEVVKIINSFEDNRITYIKNKTNLGGALSRNVGIENSIGNYIAFLDDDDEYLPEKIQKQYELFKSSNNNLALVYCYCKAVKNNKIVSVYKYDYRGNCIYDAMKTCIAATSQWMCKKEALIDVGMFTNSPCKQDSIVILKLLLKGYEIDRVPEVLSIYNEDGSSRISTKGALKRIEGENILHDLCVKNYDKINDDEQREIEYNFALNTIFYYYELDDKSNYKKCLKIINSIHRFSRGSIKIKYILTKKKIKKIFSKK